MNKRELSQPDKGHKQPITNIIFNVDTLSAFTLRSGTS